MRCAARLSCLVLTLAACSESDAEDGDMGDDAAGDDDGGDDGWTIDDPPRYAYTDETLPRMEVPADMSEWDTTDVPLPEIGMDTGEPGIVYSAALLGYYQMRMVDEAEGFHYEYHPEDDTFTETSSVHRKAVSTFSLTWLYKFTRRDEFRLSAERVMQFLVDQAEVQEDGSWKLRDIGATSMACMGFTQLAELTGTTRWDEAIDRMGAHVLSLVNPDGSLQDGSPLYFAQAHLGLWRLYSYTRDERYLDALETVARFFYDNRDNPEVLDSKHLYALWAHEPLAELYTLRPADWIPEFVFENSDAVIAEQYTLLDEGDVEDRLIGSFVESSGDRQWRAILKLEGTIDAYRVAVLAGDAAHVEAYRKSSLLSVRYLQGLQYRAGDTDGFADPPRAIGGVPYGFDFPTVRIEVPGHMVNAMLKVVQYMDLEDYPGRDM